MGPFMLGTFLAETVRAGQSKERIPIRPFNAGNRLECRISGILQHETPAPFHVSGQKMTTTGPKRVPFMPDNFLCVIAEMARRTHHSIKMEKMIKKITPRILSIQPHIEEKLSTQQVH